MKLLTKAIAKKLPALYTTEKVPPADKVLLVKFFAPWNRWTWYGVEYDPEQRIFFGYVKGQENEWGYFSLTELEGIRSRRWGLKIERDKYFDAVKFSELSE